MNTVGNNGEVGTKEKILEIAAELFAEKGFDGVSIRDITKAAGANLGAVTYHFGSKEGLFGEIILSKTEPLRRFGEEIEKLRLSPKEKLSRILMEYSTFVLHREPSLKAIFIESMQGGDRLPANAKEMITWRNQVIGQAIQEGIESGEFRPCDVEMVSMMFFGLVMPFILEYHIVEPHYRKGAYPLEYVQRIVQTALDLLFRGLEKRKGPA